MGFFDYFYIAAFVLLILFIVYDVILIAVNSQRIRKISRKTAVKKSIKFDIWWIVLSVLNAYLNFEQYRTVNRDTRLHLLAFVSWTLCGIAHILTIFLDKYIYVTPDGLFYKSMIKIQPKEKYRYRIDSDTLELYYKENDTPAKYGISGDKDELAELLDENYVKYIGD